MPGRIKAAKQRTELTRLVVWLVRYVCIQYMGDDKFGASSGDVVLCCAIFTGQAEGRPMTPGKLAEYIGMPRPTVIRRIKVLEKRGLVEMLDGKAFLPLEKLNRPHLITTLDDVSKRIHRASVFLSKMDSNPIA